MPIRVFKYRCYPSSVQAGQLAAWQLACWEVQKFCILQRRWAWYLHEHKYDRAGLITGAVGEHIVTVAAEAQDGVERRLPSWASQGREVTEVRRVCPDWVDAPADMLSAIVRRVDRAYGNWCKRITQKLPGGRPHWARRASNISLELRGGNRGTRIVRQVGRFAWCRLAGAGKLGELKIRYHRTIPDDAMIRQVRVVIDHDEWYLSFVCEFPALKPLPPPEKRVNAVNVTIGHRAGNERQIATLDDGRRYTVPEDTHTDHRLRVLQRLVEPQRKIHPNAKAADPHSKRTARRRTQIARLRQFQARRTEHVQHYAAKQVVQTAEAIAYEQRDWRAERRNARPRKGQHKRGTRKIERQVHQAMAVASPGRFLGLIKQKAEAGRAVVELEPQDAVEECSVCGASIERKAIGRRKRGTCPSCDTIHDRALNKARVLQQRALSQLEGKLDIEGKDIDTTNKIIQ